MATRFVMIVPMEYEPRKTGIVKLESTVPYRWSKRGLGGAIEGALVGLGLRSKTVEFDQLPIGWARGTHFEFVQPDDVVFVSASLTADQHDAHRGPPTFPHQRVMRGMPRVNLNVSLRNQNDPTSSRADSAEIFLRLRPRLEGTLMMLFVTALGTAVVLAVFAARLPKLDAQTGSAAALLLPALAGAYFARQGEHAVASRLLAGARAGGLMVAMAAIAAIVFVAASNRQAEGPQIALWTMTAGVGVIAMLLAAAVVSTRWAIKRGAVDSEQDLPGTPHG